ncbi:NACHT domain-containing protein [Actinotalea subterranea]|uniref:NACHT domain-containing protein n=1 Tax=Actinotalea subterranea TaxID=2607497 RepID=UPI0011ED5352|nr:hypothetical protein [Actinotalea subterranea]
MTDPLTSLSATAFQQLAAALAVRALGAGVHSFGRGPDGGRDFTFRGPLNWDGEDGQSASAAWDGYTVFQAKQKDKLSDQPTTDATWVAKEIRAELDAWVEATRSRMEVPDYLIFVTNVRLSPVGKKGGIDTVKRSVNDHLSRLKSSQEEETGTERDPELLARARCIRDWRIWDGNQLESLLTAYSEVRRSVPGMLTAGDVLSALQQLTGTVSDEALEPALRRHATTRLIEDQYVYFDEAGSDPADKTPLHDVVIDLPVADEQPNTDQPVTKIIRHVIEHGDRSLRPSQPLLPLRSHIVLAAGPGNGKTTVSKFIIQVYRAAMLEHSELGPRHQAVVEGTRAALDRMGCPMPSNRRWPIRVDLAQYTERYSSEGESHLLRWISELVNQSAVTGDVKPYHLDAWLLQWPWLLVLDGLDEVASRDARRRLIQEIESFVAEAETRGADLLVVVTTRPTGYNEEIAPTQFARLDLARLTTGDAVAYGTLVTQMRLHDEPERGERIQMRLSQAVDDEALRHLMQTPLQVLILTLILESNASLPTDRYGLFDRYFETVFRRETNKNKALSEILQRHRPHITSLHERVGFKLQCRSEEAAGAMASLSPVELREEVQDLLRGAGFRVDGDDAHVVDEIVDAATLRLVLLTPRAGSGVGFEIRSLQELMAARYLTGSGEDGALNALRVAAPSPHWRNTWIFAAGRIFADGPDRVRRQLIDLLRSLDTGASERLSRLFPLSPTLALALIDDGLARSYPTHQESLVRIGVESLADPLPAEPLVIARGLVRAAEGSDRLRTVVANRLRKGLAGGSAERSTTEAVLSAIPFAVYEAGLGPELLGLTRVVPSGAVAEVGSTDSDQDLRAAMLDVLDDADGLRDVVEAAARELEELRRGEDSEPTAIYLLLDDQAGAPALELALESAASHELLSALGVHVVPGLLRRPVGPIAAAAVQEASEN